MYPFPVREINYELGEGLVSIVPELNDLADVQVSCCVWACGEHSNVIIEGIELIDLHVNVRFHVFKRKQLTLCSDWISKVTHIQRVCINLEIYLMFDKESFICIFL